MHCVWRRYDPKLRAAWSRQRRHCAHPSVYLGLLPLPTAALSIDTILLATDDDEAAAAFPQAAALRTHARRTTIVRAFNRSQLAHRRVRKTMNQWIEHRDALSSDVLVSALEPIRTNHSTQCPHPTQPFTPLTRP